MISLQEYLKKYSVINNKFIDDFFSLYDRNTTENDFVINLETIAKWLKSIKGDLKKTLTNSYTKNIDYKTKKGATTGGRPNEIVLLTPDCFKRLTMSSKTKKSEEVRTYFIELEKHIDKYKNHIIEALNKQVDVLHNNQKPKINNNGGVIYVLKSDKDIEGIFRIGKTKKFRERKLVHDSSHPDDMEIVFIYETKNIDEVENCLKAVLKSKQYRKRKEFYQIDENVLKELIDTCDNMTLKVKKTNKKIKQFGGMYIMIQK
jgi:phage anti-repressor protein